MTEAVFQFKAIRQKLDRQDQKAEYEAKNPEPSMYGWPYGAAVPYVDGVAVWPPALINVKI